MERKDFIKTCCIACIGGTMMTTILSSCAATAILHRNIIGDDLIVPIADFESTQHHEKRYHSYIVVQNDRLKYPICVYRTESQEYTALWMKCTHQGTELQVFGDKLQCPAHGSEFNNQGNLINGPADKPLRTFPIRMENNQLNISLKAL